MKLKNIGFTTALSLTILLQACAPAIIATGATGAAVANDSRTTGTFIEDQAIELKARGELGKHQDIKDNSNITIVSFNTIVLVAGQAPTQEMINKIINIIKNIDKVSHVHNEMQIAAPSSLTSRSSDALLTTKVKTKMLADENVKGLKIKVVSELGTVYLMGIATRKNAELATNVARSTGGVQKVVKLFQYID